MAALLVAGSTPGGTRRRLSFRRLEKWSDPLQSDEDKARAKKNVELLLWSEIGENCHPPLPTQRLILGGVHRRADDFARRGVAATWQ